MCIPIHMCICVSIYVYVNTFVYIHIHIYLGCVDKIGIFSNRNSEKMLTEFHQNEIILMRSSV